MKRGAVTTYLKQKSVNGGLSLSDEALDTSSDASADVYTTAQVCLPSNCLTWCISADGIQARC